MPKWIIYQNTMGCLEQLGEFNTLLEVFANQLEDYKDYYKWAVVNNNDKNLINPGNIIYKSQPFIIESGFGMYGCEFYEYPGENLMVDELVAIHKACGSFRFAEINKKEYIENYHKQYDSYLKELLPDCYTIVNKYFDDFSDFDESEESV